jgi:hypothetical protein
MGYNSFCMIQKTHANLAQSVEQRIRNAQVAGSNPAVGSTLQGLCGRKYRTNTAQKN